MIKSYGRRYFLRKPFDLGRIETFVPHNSSPSGMYHGLLSCRDQSFKRDVDIEVFSEKKTDSIAQVSTMDGAVHALNVDGQGELLWQANLEGGPLLAGTLAKMQLQRVSFTQSF